MDSNDLLVEVKNLQTYFFLDEGTVRAVDGCDFDIHRGEVWVLWEAAVEASLHGRLSELWPSRVVLWAGRFSTTGVQMAAGMER